MTDAASNANGRRGIGARAGLIAGINQFFGMFGCAADGNGTLHTRRAERAAPAVTVRAIEKKPLAIRQFQPLRDDLTRRFEHTMNRPQRDGTAVFCKGETRAIEQLRNISGRIDADQKERNLLEPGLCSVVMRCAVCSKLVPN
jgi:hypothetical protein